VDRPRFDLAAFRVSPRRHSDFAWAFGTRFLVQLGNALGTLYLLYFLTDKVRYRDPEGGLLILILIYGGTDGHHGRRGPAVGPFRSAQAVRHRLRRRDGVAAAMLAVAPTWPVVMAAAAVLGAGYGAYLAVDAALITQVLPTAYARAKDLGVINIANSAPQVIAPAMAAPIVTFLGGYPVLYGLTAVVTLLGGVFVYRIRPVD
jgi:MFS family permease